MRYPDRWEKQYAVYFTRMVNQWEQAVREIILPNLESLTQEANIYRPSISSNIKLDDWTANLNALINELRITLENQPAPQKVQDLTDQIFHNASDFNRQQWQQASTAYFGLPLLQTEPWIQDAMNAFIQGNVNLITRTKAETISQVETVVNKGISQGLRHETIRKQILAGTDLEKGVFHKVKTRATLIARDQVGKLNGQLTQLRQTEVGISEYFWRTSLDERVRVMHKAMSGRLCRWDDPTVFKYSMLDKEWKNRSSIGGVELHPGQDYQCRCWAEANFETLDFDIAI